MDTEGKNGAYPRGPDPSGTAGVQNSRDARVPTMERYWEGGKFSLVDLPLLMMTCAIIAGAFIIIFTFIVLIVLRRCRECRRKSGDDDEATEEEEEVKLGGKHENARRKMSSILFALQAKEKFAQFDGSRKSEAGIGREEVKEKPLQFERPVLPQIKLSGVDEGIEGDTQPAPLVAASGLMALPRDHVDHEPYPVSAPVLLPDEKEGLDALVPQYGRLWFSIVYNEVSQKLFIRVIKAKYLKPRDKNSSVKDPFVKVFLLPDEFNIQEFKITDNTSAPHFDQTLEFTNIRPDVIKLKTVRISVYDMDKRRVRHGHGHVILPLAGYDVASGVVIWRDLEPDDHLPTAITCGELSVTLTHESQSQSLIVSLKEGRNMKNCEYYGRGHSIHIQLKLGDRIVQKMTTLCRPFADSVYYEDEDRFVLSIPFDQLKTCSLIMLICIDPIDEGRYDDDKRGIIEAEQTEAGLEIGRLVLGLETYSCGSGVEHWQHVMDNSGNVSTRWHNVLSSIQLHTP